MRQPEAGFFPVGDMDRNRMELQTESDELYQTQTENRHLKNTIVALRDELEKSRIDKEDSVQKAIQASNDEIVQLKSTASALREELERNNIAHEDKEQELERAHRDEQKQLQQMISTLRDKLEADNGK
ncbi:MAG: hypothetical protein V3U53_01295 [bacterium]